MLLKSISAFFLCCAATMSVAESSQKIINLSSVGAFDSDVQSVVDVDNIGFGRTMYKDCILKHGLGFYSDRELRVTSWQVHLNDLDLNNVIVNRDSKYSEQLLIPLTKPALAQLQAFSEIEVDADLRQSFFEIAVQKGLNRIKARSYSGARARNDHRLKTLLGHFGDVPARTHLVSYGAGYPEISVKHFVEGKRVTLTLSRTEGGRVLAALIGEKSSTFCKAG